MKLGLLGVSALLLAACGGEGSEPSNNPTLKTPAPLSSKQLVNNAINAFDDNILRNQAVELFLYYPQNELSNIEWTQT